MSENRPERRDLPAFDDASASRPPLLTVREGALFAGLCAGIARRYGLDATLVRVPVALLLVAGLVFWVPLFIAVFALYVLLWLCIPQEDPSSLER